MNLNDLLLRDLASVVAVAEHGHFGRAAAALRIAQPTLSAQVRKVERALASTLFERTGRSFLVTPEGQRVLPRMREVLALSATLDHGVESRRGTDPGALPRALLRVGIIPTLGPYLMPHLLLPLRRERPDLELEISERTTAVLTDSLLAGELDAAILSLPVRHQSIESVRLFEEPFRLMAPSGHALVGEERLTPARLKASEMVLLEEGHCLRDQAIAACARRGGSQPRVVTTSLETLKYLVAGGAGYSLLPELACDLAPGLARLVSIRAFDERAPSRRIVLCYRRTIPRRALVQSLGSFIRGRMARHFDRGAGRPSS